MHSTQQAFSSGASDLSRQRGGMGRAQMSVPKPAIPSHPSKLPFLSGSLEVSSSDKPHIRAVVPSSFLSLSILAPTSSLSTVPLICPSHLPPGLPASRHPQAHPAHSCTFISQKPMHGCLCPLLHAASLPITNCSTWRSKPAASVPQPNGTTSTAPGVHGRSHHARLSLPLLHTTVIPKTQPTLASLFVFAPALSSTWKVHHAK